ncbi:MAG: hypothetical protein IPP72_19615 [Chitinophagaceae bacterium]|nr:hypothetical protein [Chitinophagaceae bacterium]
MSKAMPGFKSGDQLSSRSVLIWRIVQAVVWCVGAGILTCLLFFPSLGILLFWNILIPVAPALFVTWPGVWRNVCPLATTNLLPRHLELSKRKRLSVIQSGKLNLVAVIALYVIIPLRHAVFNSSGPATGILIISMATIGILLGFVYEWKSAWCSGLCPVHPVEKLYGGNVIMSLPNAHCNQCRNCVVICPDSTHNVTPSSTPKTTYHQMSALLITGGLPGFVWGWFHVPDDATITTFQHFAGVYEMPLLGFIITLIIYTLLLNNILQRFQHNLTGIFAATAVSCYYWYRVPALFGFGKFADDGLLINLRNIIPAWSIDAIIIITTAFFFYWLVVRKPNNKSWVIRPQYAKRGSKGLQHTSIDFRRQAYLHTV